MVRPTSFTPGHPLSLLCLLTLLSAKQRRVPRCAMPHYKMKATPVYAPPISPGAYGTVRPPLLYIPNQAIASFRDHLVTIVTRLPHARRAVHILSLSVSPFRRGRAHFERSL